MLLRAGNIARLPPTLLADPLVFAEIPVFLDWSALELQWVFVGFSRQQP